MGSKDNLVAFATLIDHDVSNDLVHGVHIGDDNMQVVIDASIQGHAPLPFPVKGELEVVDQAIGSHVAWPKNLVIFSEKEVANN